MAERTLASHPEADVIEPTALAAPRAGDPLILPLGQGWGTTYVLAGSALGVARGRDVEALHQVRVGTHAFSLGLDHHVAWQQARLPLRPGARGRLRSELEEDLVTLGVPEPGRVLRELHESGLLTEVVPGEPSAVEMATTCRLRPTMLLRGNHSDSLGTYSVGTLERSVVEVDLLMAELYPLAHCSPTLYDACAGVASMCGLIPELAHLSQTEQVLTEVLHNLHLLLAADAAHLDREPT